MGMFKKKKHEREPEDYYSGTYDKWAFDGEDSDQDLKNSKNHAMELYDAFEKAREKKEKETKVEGRPDYETRKKQEKSKLEEEKYDHLLNSVQAQTLIQAVEKNYSTEIKNKTENNDEKENITIKEPVDTRRFGTHDLEVYVKQQCEIMEEAAGYIESVKSEYEAVTEDFNDIQLIDEAPEDIKNKIVSCAEIVDNMMVDRRILKSSEHKLSNAAYRRLETFEDEIPSGIRFIHAQEEYYDSVKQDLRILEAEKMNLRLESRMLVKRQLKIRTLAKTAFIALVIVFVIFIISMMIVESDSDTALFIIVSLLAAILSVGMVAILKLTERNVLITEIKLNKTIGLLNKIKIKYINVSNTLDYEYSKFGVKSAYELEKKFKLYKEMKEEQNRMLDMTSSLNSAESDLENILKKLGVYDTHVWFGRVKALINPKEMVEVRHELNTRRYKLRQQIEYNEKRIEEAKSNIKNVTLSNPEHSDGAMRVIEMYEKRHSRVAK